MWIIVRLVPQFLCYTEQVSKVLFFYRKSLYFVLPAAMIKLSPPYPPPTPASTMSETTNPYPCTSWSERWKTRWGLSPSRAKSLSNLGAVPRTSADGTTLREDLGYAADTPFREGVGPFAPWYRHYFDTYSRVSRTTETHRA